MSTAYIVVTLVGAAMAAFSAGSVFFHAKWVVQPLAEYGVPRSWWPWLGTAKAAGAAGLVVGLFVPVIGVLAGVGLVLYFRRGRRHRVPRAVVLAPPVPTGVRGVGGRFPGAGARLLSTWPVCTVTRTGFHSVRHCIATLLIHAGASVKTVQLGLGHSTPTITLNTYVGLGLDHVDRTRTLVDDALGAVPAVAVAP